MKSDSLVRFCVSFYISRLCVMFLNTIFHNCIIISFERFFIFLSKHAFFVTNIVPFKMGLGSCGIWIPDSLYLNACTCIPLPEDLAHAHGLNSVSRESLPKALLQDGKMTFSL